MARAPQVSRDPYTIARELEALTVELRLTVHDRPRQNLARDLQTTLDLTRELRRAMVRRIEPICRTEDTDNA